MLQYLSVVYLMILMNDLAGGIEGKHKTSQDIQCSIRGFEVVNI
jgi:hypothetical protein